MDILPVKSNLTHALGHIINLYFMGFYSIIIIYEWPPTNQLHRKYLTSVENVLSLKLKENNLLIVQWIKLCPNYTDYSDILHRNIELGSEGYITIISNVDNFLTIKGEIQQYSEQRVRDKIFLFLTENIDENIFDHMYLPLYPNHIFMQPSFEIDSAFDLISQRYQGIENNSESMVLNRYFLNSGTFEFNNVLYWDKIANLKGREVTIAAMTYVPYTITKIRPPGMGEFSDVNSTEKKTISYDGTEARVVIEFCRLRNCTIKIKPFEGDFFGEVINGTANGILGAVYYGEVEFTIGCLYKWYYDLFDLTYSIAKSAVTLLVPGAVPLSYALTPILPFDSLTWIFLFVSLNVVIIIYYFIQIYSQVVYNQKEGGTAINCKGTFIRDTYLEVISIMLQQSFHIKTNRFPVRLINLILLISGITLENAYSGELKSLLTIPRFNDKIETIHQFVKTGYHWGGPQPAWAFTISHSEVPDEERVYQVFESRNNDILRNKSLSRNYAIAIERLHAGGYSFGDYVKMDAVVKLDMIREDVYYEYTNGYAINGWPLMEYFNKIALEITQHGLFHRWENEIVNRYLDFTTENYLRLMAIGYSEPARPAVLQVEHIFGPMFMLFMGLLIASIVFITEISCQKFRK